MSQLPCPLCQHIHTQHYHQDKRRHYFQCNRCELVFVHPDSLPSLKQETAEYQLHENASDDPGYRKFLSRVTTPLLDKLTPPARGLDFGCGPAPVLAEMLSDAGMTMSVYDPIFHAQPSVLSHHYDFITCTEAIEHFHNPARELRILTDCLTPAGILVIMTKRVISATRFAHWHYKNDPTHVAFYSTATFEFIAARYGFHATFVDKDVVLLQKHG
ncbi:class I SAM-dependent methyltransferase [Alteromonas sp. ASW11-19]|uniref:Class I SAM-dependent methyltransferase n=1 Tax=Alteromonas salexigens TaxID=2982530 RepID=A0ABT2VKS4_9ALTE|nr:class I SAM-dependent methyltransferase [Alteromonas salexigens]MCU7553629.1 class I SAM-dependent methyltransferase [Alteromonas salexigens]